MVAAAGAAASSVVSDATARRQARRILRAWRGVMTDRTGTRPFVVRGWLSTPSRRRERPQAGAAVLCRLDPGLETGGARGGKVPVPAGHGHQAPAPPQVLEGAPDQAAGVRGVRRLRGPIGL